MSYFDYFCNINTNKDQRNTSNKDAIKGECLTMCPQEEINMRIRETLVHVLEVVGSGRKLVKSFSRSAADSLMAVPLLLRPFTVLRDTVEYLVLEVTERTDVPLHVVYDFVDDRLRAIRQDMTIQRLPSKECMVLLEPMIRFYVYFGFRLCEYPISEYDPVLNNKHLLECLKLFLCYADAEPAESTYNDNNSDLAERFSNMLMKKNKLPCDRILMESLYILCNLHNVIPIYRYLKLSDDYQRKPPLAISYKLAIANLQGNFVHLAKLSKMLCPLTYCALWVQMPEIQRNALQVLSHAYNKTSVPCTVLRQWLLCCSDADVTEICAHYGLPAQGDKVKFSKADYKPNTILKKKNYSQDKLDLSIQNIFTYDTNTFYKLL